MPKPARNYEHHTWVLRDLSNGKSFTIYIPQEEMTWSKSVNWSDVGIGGVLTIPIEYVNGAPYQINLKIFMDCTDYATWDEVNLKEDIDCLKGMVGHILRLIVADSHGDEKYNVVMTNLSFNIKERHCVSNLPTRCEADITLKQA